MSVNVLRKRLVKTISITFVAFALLTIALACAITFQVIRAIYYAHGAPQTVQPTTKQGDQTGVPVAAEQAQQTSVETGNRPTSYAENPYYIKHSERIQIAINSLLLLVIFWQLIAVAIQAYIYQRQRKLMQRQWLAMRRSLTQAREQTKIAGDTLRISTQAYVCVRDIKLDLVKDRIFIEVENLGRVPADSVEIHVWLRLEILPELGLKNATHQEVFTFGRKTALFSGNLPINIRIPHAKWLSPDHVGYVKSGVALLIAEGLITFYDGFLPPEPKKTHFAFAYRLGDKKWLPQRILSPEELEAETKQENTN